MWSAWKCAVNTRTGQYGVWMAVLPRCGGKWAARPLPSGAARVPGPYRTSYIVCTGPCGGPDPRTIVQDCRTVRCCSLPTVHGATTTATSCGSASAGRRARPGPAPRLWRSPPGSRRGPMRRARARTGLMKRLWGKPPAGQGPDSPTASCPRRRPGGGRLCVGHTLVSPSLRSSGRNPQRQLTLASPAALPAPRPPHPPHVPSFAWTYVSLAPVGVEGDPVHIDTQIERERKRETERLGIGRSSRCAVPLERLDTDGEGALCARGSCVSFRSLCSLEAVSATPTLSSSALSPSLCSRACTRGAVGFSCRE